MLTVVSVAYALAPPLGPGAAGGAEQVLSAIDAALVRAGHRSIVVASEGSAVEGELLATPRSWTGPIGEEARTRAEASVRAQVTAAAPRADLIHLHGIDFYAILPPSGPTVLATLHLPLDWYSDAALRPGRPRTFLHGVSASQTRRCADGVTLLPPIDNGVPVGSLGAVRHGKRRFALVLGRICPEKGQHLAIAAARRADHALLVAGTVFPYPDHLAYFETAVKPSLDDRRRFIGSVGLARKRRLLSAATCLLVPSLAAETSSLVAMEAISCGTPVIAFRAGALPDIVEDGVTGFLVDDVDGMANAIDRARTLDAARCRAIARARFDVRTMTDAYLARYRSLVA